MAQQTTGRVGGRVYDEYNGMTLPQAAIEVVQTGQIVYSDLDGNYSLDLPAGTYDLKVTFSGYQERTMRAVVVTPGRTNSVDIILFLQGVGYSEEIVVRAEEPETSTEAAQFLNRRRAETVNDNIGGETMRENADSNAASAMQRVPGLSVVDNSYVFVRGLGARYSNSTLNGTTLPSTEPDKRVVPLDLFPSGMIDNIQVVKTYSPDLPGEFSGGLVEINSLAFPVGQRLAAGVKFGGDSQTAFNTGIGYPGGGRDWSGFDDGTRALPGTIPPGEKVTRGGIYTDLGFTRAELEVMGESFNNEWSARPKDHGMDQAYQLYYGNRWDKLGIVASYSYDNQNSYRDEYQNYFRVAENLIEPRSEYDFQVDTNTVKQAGVGNVRYRLTPNHRLQWDNFWTHTSNNETRTFEGYNDDIATDIRNTRLRWIEEDVLSSKGSGTHFFPSLANSRIEWHFAYNRATRDEPDLRETLYERNGDEYVLADESQSGFRQFIDQQDDVKELGLDWSLYFDQWNGLPAMFKFGPYYSTTQRDFQSRRFRFLPRFTRNLDMTAPPEELFAADNIGINFELREETRTTDAYDGTHDIMAFYGMIDLPLAESWRLVTGVRVEDSEQIVNTFDLFGSRDAADLISTDLQNTDPLPAVNLIYQAREDMNVRFGFSQTVNRPQFRELAPFEFTDVIGGRAIVGNPDLLRAKIANYDVRWEWFPGPTEVIAASFFYKDFTDPIERIVEPTAQLRTSYTNAEGARNVGFELEAQMVLSDYFNFGANYTYVDSQIEIGREAGQVQTSTERPLAGTSPNLFNGFAELRVPSYDLQLRFLMNWFDDRIIDVGSLGLPDIIEEAREQFDIVVLYRFDPVVIRAAFENLTDSDYLFTQGGETQRLFHLGRNFSFGASFDFF
jgi:outer membrane receptor protein involved in Fe transport